MRRILERFCSERGIDSDLLTGIKLAVTEAASNAVLHGYLDRPPGKVTLRALVEGPDLLIQVIDEGRGMSPRVDSPGLGLGLSLIASFADDVEIAAGPGG